MTLVGEAAQTGQLQRGVVVARAGVAVEEATDHGEDGVAVVAAEGGRWRLRAEGVALVAERTHGVAEGERGEIGGRKRGFGDAETLLGEGSLFGLRGGGETLVGVGEGVGGVDRVVHGGVHGRIHSGIHGRIHRTNHATIHITNHTAIHITNHAPIHDTIHNARDRIRNRARNTTIHANHRIHHATTHRIYNGRRDN